MYVWLVTRTFSLCVRYCWQAVWKIFQLWWIGRLLISRWVFVVSRLNYSLDPVSPATEHWLHQLRSQHILIRDNIVKKIYRTKSWIVDPVTSIIVIIARIVVDNFLLQGMSLVPLWSYSKYSSLMIHGWWDLIVMNFNLKYGKCKFVCTAQ